MASSEGKVGKKECKENIAVGGKGRGTWGKQQGSLHHTCTIVHKQYQPYTLRIIYLTYFFCEILCPERQIYLKNLGFLFFLRSEKSTQNCQNWCTKELIIIALLQKCVKTLVLQYSDMMGSHGFVKTGVLKN